VPAMTGWRREVFGSKAIALKHGRMALAIVNRRLCIVPTVIESAT
jgi:ribonuclease D